PGRIVWVQSPSEAGSWESVGRVGHKQMSGIKAELAAVKRWKSHWAREEQAWAGFMIRFMAPNR
ncbi:hypothetical protein GOODEAATRI_032684, partial [Goodea atripinnis]